MSVNQWAGPHRFVPVALLVVGVLAAAGTSAVADPSSLTDAVQPAVAGQRTPVVGAHPHAIRAERATNPAGQVLFNCQTSAGNESGLHCYGPDQIRAAYRIQPLLDHGITGRGRTIVLLEAYGPPNVEADLHTFDDTWGLPDPEVQVIAPQGVPAFDGTDPVQTIWAAETALDTQWAHVVAPEAKIVVVEARSTLDPDVLAATEYAVDHNLGDVISMSFGEPERCVKPSIQFAQHMLFARATRKEITLIAGTGDSGAAQTTCDGTGYLLATSSPASDPNVLAVGGTSLTADPATGKYLSETVWNESAQFQAAGGGGYSSLYAKPRYQRGSVSGTKRGLPDVSYNAGIGGGVICYLSGAGPGIEGFYILGGTSAGAPQWAGLAALAAQMAGHRIGELNASLYSVARKSGRLQTLLHDITVGDNSFTGIIADGSTESVPGYQASTGWDAASGLGTPIAAGLVPFFAGVRPPLGAGEK